MPCRFSGIFYVQTNKYGLSAIFFDALDSPHNLKISYFSDVEDATTSPFPEAYTDVDSGSIYLITGSFVHRPRCKIPCLTRILGRGSRLRFRVTGFKGRAQVFASRKNPQAMRTRLCYCCASSPSDHTMWLWCAIVLFGHINAPHY